METFSSETYLALEKSLTKLKNQEKGKMKQDHNAEEK